MPFMPVSLNNCMEAACRAAQEAGALLARHADKSKTVSIKRNAIDLVTEIDKASEKLIRRILNRAAPGFGFLGEESAPEKSSSPYRWIVDPIDGTNNFVHGLPLFGVSIGLEHNGEMTVGVIYDPMRRELFSALRGHGAHLNGRRIRVSPTRELSKSLLATGFSFNFRKHPQPYLGSFQDFQCRSHGVRRIGSTVFCLASVAAGRVEGFYERDLWPWDVAAGMLLVEEAGGKVSNLEGKPATLTGGRLLATNGHIHPQMLRVLKKRR